jgi:putative ABC transport system permease protein
MAMFMLLSYFKIAFRNLRRKWLFSFINIFGLAIGISASVMIILYVLDEFSYDHFHPGAENIYRVNIKARISGQDIEAAATCPPMANALRDEFPEVEDAIRIALWQDVPVIQNEKAFTEKRILLADSNFFSFFGFQLISGDPKAFGGPNKIVISKTMAEKYFGDGSPIGKQIEIGTSRFNCEITGIIEDNPANSHIQYDMIMSMDTWENSKQPFWINNFLYTYFRVVDNANLSQTREKFNELVIKYVGPEAEEVFGGAPLEEYQETNDFYYGYTLTPLTDIHLRSKLTGEMNPAGNIQYSYIFIIIAAFIIIIALINFINLFTAHSAKKGREVGIRKTVGAMKEKLIAQFMTESILQAFLAMLIAGAIIHLTIGSFNGIAEKNVEFNAISQPWIIPLLIFMSLAIGFLAGIYPSFYLSSFQPAKVLRGEKGGGKSGIVRKYLVILQYAISTGLILSSLVIYRQLTLLQEKNLGFDKEQILVVENCWSLDKNKKAFKEKVLTFPFVKSVSYTTHLPPHVTNSSLFRGVGENMDDQLIHHYWTDPDHMDVMNLQLKEGRYYSDQFPTDSNAIIINETALERFGWESCEGHQIIDFNQDSLHLIRTVIGVVKDFNFASLHQEILPMAILPGDFGNLVAIKIKGEHYEHMISALEDEWKKYVNGAPFDYYFLNQKFDTLYRTEQRTSRVVLIFTILAVVIASLGLFGLASYSADRRTHEIGIRKVMGASSYDIVSLLNRDFMKLVLYGMLVSLPLSIPLLKNWLNTFSYRINITWDIFIFTAMIAILLALFTISIKAIRTSWINPAQAIKIE